MRSNLHVCITAVFSSFIWLVMERTRWGLAQSICSPATGSGFGSLYLPPKDKCHCSQWKFWLQDHIQKMILWKNDPGKAETEGGSYNDSRFTNFIHRLRNCHKKCHFECTWGELVCNIMVKKFWITTYFKCQKF